jgi:uncharacterized membrane protein YedE/YeeE
VKALAAAGAAGFVFGIGLWISGMANPRKVIGFLDVTGAWDASLAFVMAGAVAVTLIAFRWVLKRGKPLLESSFQLPTKKDIDAPLVAGAAIFGIGWGIAGYCPGPAITALTTLAWETVVFVAAMIAGGVLHKLVLGKEQG